MGNKYTICLWECKQEGEKRKTVVVGHSNVPFCRVSILVPITTQSSFSLSGFLLITNALFLSCSPPSPPLLFYVHPLLRPLPFSFCILPLCPAKRLRVQMKGGQSWSRRASVIHPLSLPFPSSCPPFPAAALDRCTSLRSEMWSTYRVLAAAQIIQVERGRKGGLFLNWRKVEGNPHHHCSPFLRMACKKQTKQQIGTVFPSDEALLLTAVWLYSIGQKKSPIRRSFFDSWYGPGLSPDWLGFECGLECWWGELELRDVVALTGACGHVWFLQEAKAVWVSACIDFYT